MVGCRSLGAGRGGGGVGKAGLCSTAGAVPASEQVWVLSSVWLGWEEQFWGLSEQSQEEKLCCSPGCSEGKGSRAPGLSFPALVTA